MGYVVYGRAKEKAKWQPCSGMFNSKELAEKEASWLKETNYCDPRGYLLTYKIMQTEKDALGNIAGNKWYVYKTTCIKRKTYGRNFKFLNMMLVQDADCLFTSEAEALQCVKSITSLPSGKGEELIEIRIRQMDREKDGYHYEYCGRTEYTLFGADDFQNYYYIEMTVKVELIEEEFSLSEQIPLSICKRSKGAMARFCTKNNGKMKWHYEVMEIPSTQIIYEY